MVWNSQINGQGSYNFQGCIYNEPISDVENKENEACSSQLKIKLSLYDRHKN